jgi:hypothetical protein
MKRIALVLILFMTASAVQAQRAFLIIQEETPGFVQDFHDDSPGGLVFVREMKLSEQNPGFAIPEGDTLSMWIQHYGPGMMMDSRAVAADILVNCYPEMMPMNLRVKHTLPMASGLIMIYKFYKVLIITDRRDIALDSIGSYIRYQQYLADQQ